MIYSEQTWGCGQRRPAIDPPEATLAEYPTCPAIFEFRVEILMEVSRRDFVKICWRRRGGGRTEQRAARSRAWGCRGCHQRGAEPPPQPARPQPAWRKC